MQKKTNCYTRPWTYKTYPIMESCYKSHVSDNDKRQSRISTALSLLPPARPTPTGPNVHS